jgi:hypothetical protein
MAYEESKPAHERMACPHCGKMISDKLPKHVTDKKTHRKMLEMRTSKRLKKAFAK